MGQSEAFSMDDSWTSLLILLFGYPHSLEGREGAQDWSSDPDQEFSLCWGNHLYFHCWGGKSCYFFAETFRNSRVHSSSTTHNNVAIEVFSNINVALEDWLVSNFMETWHLFTNHHGLEESFRTSESLRWNCDHLSVRKFICLVILCWSVIGYIGSEFTSNLGFVIKSNIAELFFDISDCLGFCWRAEVQSYFIQELSHIFSQITSC